MYGDHHVIEVRRLLLELPGVQDVYASSAFQVVEVTYDPAQLDAGAITARLDEAGYLGDLLVPVIPAKRRRSRAQSGKPAQRSYRLKISSAPSTHPLGSGSRSRALTSPGMTEGTSRASPLNSRLGMRKGLRRVSLRIDRRGAAV